MRKQQERGAPILINGMPVMTMMEGVFMTAITAAGDNHHLDHGGVGHVHAPARFDKAFAIGITLNTALVAAEAVYPISGTRPR